MIRQQIRKDYDALRSEGSRMAEAIRTAVMLNPSARVEDVIAALPELKPQTIRNRFRESKLISKEMGE